MNRSRKALIDPTVQGGAFRSGLRADAPFNASIASKLRSDGRFGASRLLVLQSSESPTLLLTSLHFAGRIFAAGSLAIPTRRISRFRSLMATPTIAAPAIT